MLRIKRSVAAAFSQLHFNTTIIDAAAVAAGQLEVFEIVRKVKLCFAECSCSSCNLRSCFCTCEVPLPLCWTSLQICFQGPMRRGDISFWTCIQDTVGAMFTECYFLGHRCGYWWKEEAW